MPFASAIDSPELVGPEELVHLSYLNVRPTSLDTSAGYRERKLKAGTRPTTRGPEEGVQELRAAFSGRMAQAARPLGRIIALAKWNIRRLRYVFQESEWLYY